MSNDYPYAAFAAHMHTRQMAAVLSSIEQLRGNADLLRVTPRLLLQAVVIPGDKTKEGQLIEAVALPWFEIIEMMIKDPSLMHQIDWRKWEEIVAGAYKRAGFEVELTPRSNDRGRDIIATSHGIGSIRFFDQVKAYGPDRRVEANDVRAMIGVLTVDQNVSKGIITTTSDFAPGVLEDENIKRLMPFRLELKPKAVLLDWLSSLEKSQSGN